ncbi:histidinol-phosphatase [Pseudomonas sp. DTU_2021_1001937_2_SI_NGA_ILE_001]|uniref:histidinol-phosphatase n=1 Tax=Pseudomonas sp. DTU_2021_1001937_2_SI_NGA_ILE_001 TaxID=3077589 RepID=UPI0028FC19C7|nr:histidinol-phosphatase [Pseudomonas sp. DTU_2021_1001937_2_SI_NGA_ILE_001]WNW10201.1 histidinol-phosphatase [Pseudomonas sp. DTU_2021_1001937_2_SI_NGA_ILE_001]
MPLSNEKLQEYLTFAHQLADASGLAIQPWFRRPLSVEDKGEALFDPVTEGDKAAERAMRELIQARYPADGILGEEEEAVAGSSGLTWVLDPIDGTRAFITGLPLWGTLIALNDGQQPVLGIMNQPFTRERYVGTREQAWCNGAPLKTRRCASLAEATLMATTPDMFDTAQRQTFDRVARQARLMRWGGDCYAYCMLASGFVDVIIEASLKPYDVQALMPIIEGAGGVMTSWTGETAQHGGPVVACGDPALHAEVIEWLSGQR